MTRLKNAKAFTLIELIVVIVIIGILVAIAAVAYNSVIGNSKKSALETQATQVAKMIQSESAAKQAVLTEAEALAVDFAGDGVKATVAGGADTNDHVLEVKKDGYTVTVTLSDVVGTANEVGKAVKDA